MLTKINKSCVLVILAAGLTLLSGCVPNISPDNYDVSQTGEAARVVMGRIISKTNVNVGSNNNVGKYAGAGIGGVAGSTLGGSPEAGIIGAIGGAVAGGIAGNAIEKGVSKQVGIRYIIKTDNDKTIAVTQGAKPELHVGQKVMVLYGDKTRVVAQ